MLEWEPMQPGAKRPAAHVVATDSRCVYAQSMILFESNFDEGDWLSPFTPKPEKQFGIGNVEVVDGTFLRVRYHRGGASKSYCVARNLPVSGLQFYQQLPARYNRMVLTYSLRFPEQFDFVRGGKLPGLYGGTRTSGRSIPSGTDGFSTRFMWREEGAGEVYAYLPTSREVGTSLGRGSWRFVPGRWHCLEQEVILNTPGELNGKIAVRVDSKRVYETSTLLFRTGASLKIEGIFFSTFFGGRDASWAPREDTYVDFAHFELRAD